jgi:hypothetical protein
MTTQAKRVVFRTQYASTYKQIPVNAFTGNTTEKGIELRAYTEEHDFTPQEPPQPNSVYVLKTIETCLVINPMQAKSLHQFLGSKIKEYEDVYGTIPSYEEVNKKLQEKAGAQIATTTTNVKKPDIGIQ